MGSSSVVWSARVGYLAGARQRGERVYILHATVVYICGGGLPGGRASAGGTSLCGGVEVRCVKGTCVCGAPPEDQSLRQSYGPGIMVCTTGVDPGGLPVGGVQLSG